MSNTTAAKKKPLYEAFSVSGEGDSAEWTKIGAVWETTKGVTLIVKDGLAVSGRIVCVSPREKEAPEPSAV
jgi:hypothetical protein